MSKISYARHRFPPTIVQRAVWLYFRFPLSFRDVEEMLGERGIEVTYETIRRWVLKFGPAIAADIRSRRFRPSGMGRFKSPGSMQRFLSTHESIYNHFNLQRHLISRRTLHQTRAAAFAKWCEVVAA